MLIFALDEMPLSVAYSTWGAVGIIGTSIGSYIFLKERLGIISYMGMVMVVCAVVLLNL